MKNSNQGSSYSRKQRSNIKAEARSIRTGRHTGRSQYSRTSKNSYKKSLSQIAKSQRDNSRIERKSVNASVKTKSKKSRKPNSNPESEKEAKQQDSKKSQEEMRSSQMTTEYNRVS